MKIRLDCDLNQILVDLEIARKYFDKYEKQGYSEDNGYLRSFFEGQMVLLCKLLDTPTERFLSMSFEEFKEDYYKRERIWRAI